jgi:Flp pilus assembly pilin Flp
MPWEFVMPVLVDYFRNESGATAIENGLIASLIAIVIIICGSTVG